jgi:hypothetical protein
LQPIPLLLSLILPTLILAAGCEPSDERLVELAEHSVEQQAAQNEEVVRLNREVAEGTRRLVEADSAARKQLIEAQRDLQRQQQELAAQRDALEQERQELARQRRTESALAPVLTTLGTTFLALLPLVLCGYLLHDLSRSPEAAVGDLLIHELASEQPLLAKPRPAAIVHRAAADSDAE